MEIRQKAERACRINKGHKILEDRDLQLCPVNLHAFMPAVEGLAFKEGAVDLRFCELTGKAEICGACADTNAAQHVSPAGLATDVARSCAWDQDDLGAGFDDEWRSHILDLQSFWCWVHLDQGASAEPRKNRSLFVLKLFDRGVQLHLHGNSLLISAEVTK